MSLRDDLNYFAWQLLFKILAVRVVINWVTGRSK